MQDETCGSNLETSSILKSKYHGDDILSLDTSCEFISHTLIQSIFSQIHIRIAVCYFPEV